MNEQLESVESNIESGEADANTLETSAASTAVDDGKSDIGVSVGSDSFAVTGSDSSNTGVSASASSESVATGTITGVASTETVKPVSETGSVDVSGGNVQTIYQIMEATPAVEADPINLWEAEFSDLSTTDTLLVIILCVLVLQLFFKRW